MISAIAGIEELRDQLMVALRAESGFCAFAKVLPEFLIRSEEAVSLIGCEREHVCIVLIIDLIEFVLIISIAALLLRSKLAAVP